MGVRTPTIVRMWDRLGLQNLHLIEPLLPANTYVVLTLFFFVLFQVSFATRGFCLRRSQ